MSANPSAFGYAGQQKWEMLGRLASGGYVRVVNYHNTKFRDAARFEAEIAYFAEHFAPVRIADVDEWFETRRWPKEKPGLIPAIYEGYRNHHDVILPILEKYGFTGWFYVPSFFLDVPVKEQADFCKGHRLRSTAEDEYPDGRYAFTWDELRRVAQNHEVCCHTGTHFNLDEDSTPEEIQREIVASKRRLEEELQKPIDVFCWLGGKEYAEYPKSHPYLEEAGYRYLVGNLKIQKLK
ncbi:MAG: polysaccharide deacetylase family protein [Candidatus Limiplasma sp.]|nr:polysaccharide deacetylase family protein [Candidatus Limiplasma sp.]